MQTKQDLIQKAGEEIRGFVTSPGEVRPEDIAYTERLDCMVAMKMELERMPLTAEQISVLMDVPDLLAAIEGEWSISRSGTAGDAVSDYLLCAVAHHRARQLLSKASQEYNDYVEQVKRLPPEQIVGACYELVLKENFLSVIERQDLSEETVDVLLTTNTPLDELYREWLGNDYSMMDMLQDTADEFAEDRLKWLLKEFLAGEPVPEHIIGRLETMASQEGIA